MIALSAGLSYFDLNFQQTERVIATAVLQSRGDVALVDPGPSSTLPVLRASLARAGVGVRDLTALLLTHIHLDHAGASGTLVRENPRLRVYVHAKGAPHMSEPAKLLASAERLYGDAMQRLWGEVRPVPEEKLVVVHGGERIEAGGRTLDVAYTPGHASHHVSYFVRDAGVAFVGDTAGVKLTPHGDVLPPTPPPDVDLDAWQNSMAIISGWQPETLFLTHFGPAGSAAAHLSELGENLEVASALVRTSLSREGTDQEREMWFVEECRRLLRRRMSETDVQTYQVAGRFDLNWRGMARYWRKRNPQEFTG
jgi:glyoxylase-like metal-dependent hydrolase (beta-lactamase superfamily II)